MSTDSVAPFRYQDPAEYKGTDSPADPSGDRTQMIQSWAVSAPQTVQQLIQSISLGSDRPHLMARPAGEPLPPMLAAWPSAACSFSSLFQLEWVTFLLIIKLPHKLNEHVLQFYQPISTPILQVLKVILKRSEPFFHS